MAINFTNIDNSRQLRGSMLLKEWITEVIVRAGKQTGDIVYAFCSDSYMREQNNLFLSHDYFTDILTFSYNEGEIISGDLLISTDTVFSNAKLFKTTYKNELHRVIIHGVLHLLGFDDLCDEDRTEMRKQENQALELLAEMSQN